MDGKTAGTIQPLARDPESPAPRLKSWLGDQKLLWVRRGSWEEGRVLTRAVEVQGNIGGLLCPVGGPGFHPESDIVEHGYAILVGELQLGGRACGKVAAAARLEAAGRKVLVPSLGGRSG